MERREQQRLARARHLGGAPLQRGRREHVDVRLREPAGEVAAAGRRGDHPGERQPRVGERERPRARMEHDRHLVGQAVEQPVHLLAKRLERLEHRRRLRPLRRVMASGERGRLRLLPGHGAELSQGPLARCAAVSHSVGCVRSSAVAMSGDSPAAFVPAAPRAGRARARGAGVAAPRAAARPRGAARLGGGARGAVQARVAAGLPRRVSRGARRGRRGGHRPGGVPRRGPVDRPVRPPQAVRPVDAPDRREPRHRRDAGARAAARGGRRCRRTPPRRCPIRPARRCRTTW